MKETTSQFIKLNHDIQKIILSNSNNILLKTHQIHEFDLEAGQFMFVKFPVKG